MIVTRQTLVDAGATCKGINLFEELFPDGFHGEWLHANQIGLLLHPEARKYWSWLVRSGVIPGYSMAYWNMMGIDLSSADVRGSDMRSVNLVNAILRRAIMIDADLRWANLRESVLIGADLRGASMAYTILRGAIMIGATMIGANLRGADMRGAVLIDADFRWADLTSQNIEDLRNRGAVVC